MSAQHDHSRCRELLGSLSDYVDGDLEEALCREIEAHMAECENCRIVVDTLRKTVLLYHVLPSDPPLPEAVEQRLFKRLELEHIIPSRSER
ncbi:MAG: zf-HC2 domain-containing protein [Caldilineales bacterium]|nr:zf-HC2 domain-containing protein [Caldilineales bacterium]MDW8318833.1 zf-HC2 domain-containing protein [Anaerolineae bacterium]